MLRTRTATCYRVLTWALLTNVSMYRHLGPEGLPWALVSLVLPTGSCQTDTSHHWRFHTPTGALEWSEWSSQLSASALYVIDIGRSNYGLPFWPDTVRIAIWLDETNQVFWHCSNMCNPGFLSSGKAFWSLVRNDLEQCFKRVAAC